VGEVVWAEDVVEEVVRSSNEFLAIVGLWQTRAPSISPEPRSK